MSDSRDAESVTGLLASLASHKNQSRSVGINKRKQQRSVPLSTNDSTGRMLPQGQRHALRIHRGWNKASRLPLITTDAKVAEQRAREEEKYVQSSLEKLNQSVEAILKSAPTSYPHEELYRYVENLAGCDKEQILWSNCFHKMQHSCSNIASSIKSRARMNPNDSGVLVMKDVITSWREWKVRVTLIRNIYFYLDQRYLLRSSKYKTVWETGQHIFSQYVLNDDEIRDALFKAIAHLAGKYETVVDPMLVRFFESVLQLCDDTNLYADRLAYTAAISFGDIGAENMTTRTLVRGYAQHRKKEREIFAALNLPRDKYKLFELELHNICYEIWKQSELQACCDREDEGVFGLDVEGEDNSETSWLLIANMYIFLSLSGEHESNKMRQEVHLHITKVLKSLLQPTAGETKADGSSIIEKINVLDKNLTDLVFYVRRYCKSQLEGVISTSWSDLVRGRVFESNPPRLTITGELVNGISSTAFHEAFNRFIDKRLKSQLYYEDEHCEVALSHERAIRIFEYVEGKDYFRFLYKGFLSRRLLQLGSQPSNAVSGINISTEESIVSRINEICGANFMADCVIMIKDITRCEKINADFLATNERDLPIRNFHVNVVSSGAWPSLPDAEVKLPESMQRQLQTYEAFYSATLERRKLEWHNLSSSCVVRAEFQKGKPKLLMVSLLQALVLLLFNDRSGDTNEVQRSYSEIADATGIVEPHLGLTLQSLCAFKMPILRAVSNSEGDFYVLNNKFDSRHVKVRVPVYKVPKSKSKGKDSQAASEYYRDGETKLIHDRRLETSSTIVRIMKAERRLSHTELITRVIDMTKDRGRLEVGSIKLEIERLIGDEYLTRSTEDANIYEYIA